MDYKNFQVGEKFPLPIKNQGDGGLFQIDANGAMFILQLSCTDIIAVEAFRTGKMEFALYEENGILFLLYQIDGIFKEGWGDCPLGIHLLEPGLKPCLEDLKDPVIHLYLVDTKRQLLLAQRQVKLDKEFHDVLRQQVEKQLAAPKTASAFIVDLQVIWGNMTSKAMRDKAIAVQKVKLNIPPPPVPRGPLH